MTRLRFHLRSAPAELLSSPIVGDKLQARLVEAADVSQQKVRVLRACRTGTDLQARRSVPLSDNQHSGFSIVVTATILTDFLSQGRDRKGNPHYIRLKSRRYDCAFPLHNLKFVALGCSKLDLESRIADMIKSHLKTLHVGATRDHVLQGQSFHDDVMGVQLYPVLLTQLRDHLTPVWTSNSMIGLRHRELTIMRQGMPGL